MNCLQQNYNVVDINKCNVGFGKKRGRRKSGRNIIDSGGGGDRLSSMSADSDQIKRTRLKEVGLCSSYGFLCISLFIFAFYYYYFVVMRTLRFKF